MNIFNRWNKKKRDREILEYEELCNSIKAKHKETQNKTSGVKNYKLIEYKTIDIVQAIPFKICNNDEIQRILKERGLTGISWLADAHSIFPKTTFMTIREGEYLYGTLFNYEDKDYSYLIFYKNRKTNVEILTRSSQDFMGRYKEVEDDK